MDSLPRITLFYDVRDWAFHNVALNVARVGASDYSFHLLGRDDWFGKPQVAKEAVMQSDIVVFLWRFDLLAFLDTLDAATWSEITTQKRPTFVTVVYDHLYQNEDDLAELGNPFEMSDVVATCSQRLRNDYARQPHLPCIHHMVPDGVDLSRFDPKDRVFDAGRPLRIGWVGNSAWGSTVDTDLKGKRTIFEPALGKLRDDGLAFDTCIADRAVNRVARQKMPDFYRGIDVLVCTSAIEGTPNPVLEAMASGAAIITTDVGIVREVLGPQQSEFVLKHRSPEALAEALGQLIRDRQLLKRLQDENLGRRETLSWRLRWPQWKDLFAEATVAANSTKHGIRIEEFFRFQSRKRSQLQRARRMVARNQLTYRMYETVREHCPSAIRLAKKILQRGNA